MKCHYEVLDVPRDADDAEIKSAYRKLALKWHPDKNLDNVDYAKEQFQLVQQAYEVLSDKHERAWYDSHREQILHGANSEFQDNSLDLFQYFGTCFKGYGDDENGFYTIYRTVFEKLAKEDMEFMDDKEEFCEIPSFGNSQTDYEKVAEFYAYWSSYITKKSYVWLDPNNIKDIRDRRYLKLVEKENKKIRQQAKKERNEEVRTLVEFVRKRDKRVQAQKKLLKQKQIINKQKREELTKQKKLQRQQELNTSNIQPEWSKFDNFKSELEELEKCLVEEFGDSLPDSESETEDVNNLYCIACNKIFKTPKSFENHESSKKHKENVDKLKTTLLEENDLSSADDYENENSYLEEDLQVNVLDINFNADKNYKINDKQSEKCSNDSESDQDDFLDNKQTQNELTALEDTSVKQKKKKKQKNVISLSETEDLINTNTLLDIVNDLDTDFTSNKKQKKSKRKNKNEKVNVSNTFEEIEQKQTEDKPKKVRKDQKMKKGDVKNSNDIDISHICLTCKSVFLSKNKLFDHLKKTCHGVYIDPNLKNKTKQNIDET